MDSQIEMATVDKSVYGLVVFLVIFIFFASLTSGLLVCLTKIWCGFKSNRQTPTELSEKQRQSILHSPVFLGEGSDSEEESMQQTVTSRRLSQRILHYVHKSLHDDKKDKATKEIEQDEQRPTARNIHMAETDHDTEISTIEGRTEGKVSFLLRPDQKNISLQNHDPTVVIHV